MAETAGFDIMAGSRAAQGGRARQGQTRPRPGQGRRAAPAVPSEYLVGKILAHDLRDPETGEQLAQANDELTPDKLENPDQRHHRFQTLYVNRGQPRPVPVQYLARRPDPQSVGRQVEIYRMMRLANRRPRTPLNACCTICSSRPSATICPMSDA